MSLAKSAQSFEAWLDAVFNHPVRDPRWWWDEPEPSDWLKGEDTALSLVMLTRVFEHPALLVDRFTDDQIGQGLWFLFDRSCSQNLDVVRDAALPLRDRRRLVEAIGTLFRELFAKRCADKDPRSSADELESTCYMLWDLNEAFLSQPGEPELDDACLQVMRVALECRNATCQVSALHGLGHWARSHPAEVAPIIDSFLIANADLPDWVRDYALQARDGKVQ